MAARQRVKKYRSEGGAADLARVEVLVPPSAREEILAVASRLRAEHRGNKELRALYDNALASYRTRILDNVDLDRLPDFRSRGFRERSAHGSGRGSRAMRQAYSGSSYFRRAD